MKYVYASRTGNVESLIGKLGLDAVRIDDGNETVDDEFILFTYTDGFGDVPMEVDTFLMANSMNIRGVVCSGSQDYGEAYCLAGDKIAEDYDVPCLYKVENDGSDEDVAAIQAALNI